MDDSHHDIERADSLTADADADRLRLTEYWPAVAMRFVNERKYAAAVQICRQNLQGPTACLSGRVVYGLALFRAGQAEVAAEQFHTILSRDPNHLVALKYLGDIAYAQGDEWGAMANYRRILEIDPLCSGLTSDLPRRGHRETARTITLVRPVEETSALADRTSRMASREAAPKRAAFYSETIGDLYLSQGHARHAAEVFQKLYDDNPSPHLAEKLARALDKMTERENSHVHHTD